MKPLKQDMYRVPWSLNDNPIGWLEVTDKCNIYCQGCYRINGMEGHKTLEQIKEEIDLLQKWRNCDNISIAGGEPLIHPNIMEVISYIRERGMKPLILTNGLKLENNRPMIEELKRAGVTGFTFHIDSFQSRPHWKGKNEIELFELREHYADMIHDVGGLFVSFGMTVYPGNIDLVPKMVKWANDRIDRVHGLVFITFRNAQLDIGFDYFAAGKRINPTTSYVAEDYHDEFLKSTDVYAAIKEKFPHYEASSYMGGTQDVDKITWLISAQLGSKNKMYGSAGAKVMELFQNWHHMRHKRYMIYSPRNTVPKIALMLGSLFDKGIKSTFKSFFSDFVKHPQRLFQPVYVQSIGIIQGPDLLPDGRVDMCESCPDMTIYDGKLVHSCRMDEWRLYGNYVVPHPRGMENESIDEVQPDAELIMPT